MDGGHPQKMSFGHPVPVTGNLHNIPNIMYSSLILPDTNTLWTADVRVVIGKKVYLPWQSGRLACGMLQLPGEMQSMVSKLDLSGKW